MIPRTAGPFCPTCGDTDDLLFEEYPDDPDIADHWQCQVCGWSGTDPDSDPPEPDAATP